MKIAKRVVTGLIGTIALTSCILYAINIHHAQRAASSLKSAADAEETVSGSSEAVDDSQNQLSIDMGERNLVYQSQDASGGQLDYDALGGGAETDESSAAEVSDGQSDTEQDAGSGSSLADKKGADSQTDTSRSDTDSQSADRNSKAVSAAESDSQNGQALAGKEKDTEDAEEQTITIRLNPKETASKTAAANDTASKNAAGKKSNDKESGSSESDKKAAGAAEKGTSKQETSKQGTSKQEAAEKSAAAKEKNKKDSDSKTENTAKTKQKNKKDTDDTRYTFQTVTEDYFSDALFIGDSRTVGMQQSGLLPGAVFYAKTGIGIGEILSERIVNENGYMITVKDALSRHSFGKVYIMIGINDISAGDTEWFAERYTEILDAVRSTQPHAVIYIQGNIPMSYAAQDLHGALNNQNLRLRDEASKALADWKTVFYLDVNTLYADANGHLASMYTTDGLHIKPNYYPLWTDYLKHRAIVH